MSADPYQKPRDTMVSGQLKARDITSARVLEAMARVPRHAFVPEELRPQAYEDCALAIGSGQTISQPYMVALMTQLLELKPDDRVLEVGTGSGYQTAILAAIAGRVVSIERHQALAEEARALLDKLGFDNVLVVVGDGTLGYPGEAPYDAIIVTAGGPRVPPSLGGQLAEGGRLICPVGPRKTQELVRLVRTKAGLEQQRSLKCSFVPLIGEEGWSEAVE